MDARGDAGLEELERRIGALRASELRGIRPEIEREEACLSELIDGIADDACYPSSAAPGRLRRAEEMLATIPARSPARRGLLARVASRIREAGPGAAAPSAA